MNAEMLMRRRQFLTRSIMAGVGAIAGAACSPVLAKTGFLIPKHYAGPDETAAFWVLPRVLDLFRPATGEHRKVCYWENGSLNRRGYHEACHMLRDVKANLTVTIDIRLLNLLRAQQGWLEMAHGFRGPYHVHSGYRAETTNEMLEGAAKDSLHTRAMASDGKYIGIPIEVQGELMKAFRSGGVGVYVNKHKFIHSDVGRVRTWKG